MRLPANRILLDPRRNMMLGPQLDCMCTETWSLDQVASLNERLSCEWCGSRDQEDDGRIGEATGEEGGESGRGAVVRVALGGAGVGGVGVGKGVGEEAWEEA